MAEKEYIEREAFRQRLIHRQITEQYVNARERHEIGCIIEMLDRAPAADVAPVVRGEWKLEWDAEKDPKKYFIRIVCSNCGLKTGEKSNFCPKCGAKMGVKNCVSRTEDTP